ncbi:MAG: ankyrin repeat domain-containing protein, partial [Gammaproteobacteria bacterium]
MRTNHNNRHSSDSAKNSLREKLHNKTLKDAIQNSSIPALEATSQRVINSETKEPKVQMSATALIQQLTSERVRSSTPFVELLVKRPDYRRLISSIQTLPQFNKLNFTDCKSLFEVAKFCSDKATEFLEERKYLHAYSLMQMTILALCSNEPHQKCGSGGLYINFPPSEMFPKHYLMLRHIQVLFGQHRNQPSIGMSGEALVLFVECLQKMAACHPFIKLTLIAESDSKNGLAPEAQNLTAFPIEFEVDVVKVAVIDNLTKVLLFAAKESANQITDEEQQKRLKSAIDITDDQLELGCALLFNNVECVEAILKRRPQFAHDLISSGQTVSPLYIAAFKGSLDLTQLLVAYGADVNEQHSTQSITALTGACLVANPQVVDFLISEKANVNALNVYKAANHKSAQKITVMEHFCKTIALRSQQRLQSSRIAPAQEKREAMVLSLLLAAHANYNRETVIKQFAAVKRTDLVQIVTQQQAPLPGIFEENTQKPVSQVRDKKNKTKKLQEEFKETTQELKEAHKAGQDEKALDLAEKRDAMQRRLLWRNYRATFPVAPSTEEVKIIAAVKAGDLDKIKMLKKTIPNFSSMRTVINTQTDENQTPLMLAVKQANKNFYAIIKFLILEMSANITFTDNEGETVIHHAVRSNFISAIVFLATHKRQEFLRIIDIKNANHETALHLAAKIGKTEMVEALVGYKANHLLRDGNGKIAAEVTENSEIKDFLATIENSRMEELYKRTEEETLKTSGKILSEAEKTIKNLVKNKQLPEERFAHLRAKESVVENQLMILFKKKPSDKRVGMVLQNLLNAMQDLHGQRQVLNEIMQNYSEDSDVQLASAWNHLTLGSYSTAENIFRKLFKHHQEQALSDKLYTSTLSGLITVAAQQRDYPQIAKLSKTLALIPNPSLGIKLRALKSKFNHQRPKPDQKEILDAYEGLLHEFESDPRILAHRAWYFLKIKNMHRAEAEFNALQETDYKNYLFGMARCSELRGRIDEAKKFYDDLAFQFPNFHNGHLCRVELYYAEISADSELFIAFVNTFPKSEVAHLYLAQHYWDNNQETKAYEAYFHAFDNFPHNMSLRVDLIYRQLACGYAEKALTFCQQLQASSPSDLLTSEFYLAFINVLVKLNRIKEALQIRASCFNQHKKMDANMRLINNFLAQYRTKKHDEIIPLNFEEHEEHKTEASSAPVQAGATDAFMQVQSQIEEKRPQHAVDTTLTHAAVTPWQELSRLYIPTSIQSILAKLHQVNLNAIFDGQSTVHMITHFNENQSATLVLYTSAPPQFLIEHLDAVEIDASIQLYQVQAESFTLKFVSLPNMDENNLIQAAQRSSPYAIFNLVTDMSGKIHGSDVAKKAYKNATISYIPDFDSEKTDYYNQHRTRILSVASLATQFNLRIDIAVSTCLKKHVMRYLGETAAALKSSEKITTLQLLKIDSAELHYFLIENLFNRKSNGYCSNVDLFFAKLVEYQGDRLLFPCSQKIDVSAQKDLVSHLACLGAKKDIVPEQILREMYTLVAVYSNTKHSGTMNYLGNLRNTLRKFGLDSQEFNFQEMVPMILQYSYLCSINPVQNSLLSSQASAAPLNFTAASQTGQRFFSPTSNPLTREPVVSSQLTLTTPSRSGS